MINLQDLARAWSWIDAHMFLVTAGIGLFFAAFNWIAKPRTAIEYAAMSPRRAALHRLLAAVFPDPKKAFESVLNIVNATRPDGSPQIVLLGQAHLEEAAKVLEAPAAPREPS